MNKRMIVKKIVSLGIMACLVCGIQIPIHALEEGAYSINEGSEQVTEPIECVEEPTISIDYNENNESVYVTFGSVETEVAIYYTLNSGEKILYSEPIELTERSVVTVVATKKGMKDSLSITQVVDIKNEQPYKTIVKVDYRADSAVVTLENNIQESELYYYLADGEEMFYTEPIHITSYTEMTVITKKGGVADSFSIKLPIEIIKGQVARPTFRANYDRDYKRAEVVLGNMTPDATVYYSIGNQEKCIYTGPISIVESTALTVMATKRGMHDSLCETHYIYIN